MKTINLSFTVLTCLGCLLPASPARAAETPHQTVKDLNTPRAFPPIASKAEWKARAAEVREQALVSCGLWPMPEKTPLNARVFGKVARDGYSIEKVALQTFPGFYLCGNLYRPLDKGTGPFPAVLNPHGHWSNGRLADTADGCIAARCISQARMGMVAFSYDMIGYNDTFFAEPAGSAQQKPSSQHRRIAVDRTNLLWNISLMGLQTWNSIRALDFLESLPDVDPKRLACTGESGGGTQTFMLGAVDARLAAQAPIVMVSSTMQGGCLCENAPGLRVEYSNMEISASAAPRPQMLVAATGDWTKLTLTVEGPAIEKMYRLLGAQDHFKYVRFDFGHNYNQTSREAVYGWLANKLLGRAESTPLPEPPYKKELDADLMVWPDGKLPQNAKTEAEIESWLVAQYRGQFASAAPHDRRSLATYKKNMTPAWKHTLQTAWPVLPPRCSPALAKADHNSPREYMLQADSSARQTRITVTLPSKRARRAAIIAYAGPVPSAGDALTSGLLERGFAVLQVDIAATPAAPDPFSNFFYVYNRTTIQERVQDLLLTSAFARAQLGVSKVLLCGQDTAGLCALLAAPAADALVADCDNLDPEDDKALLQPDLFCPGLKKMGAFQGAALLAAPAPMLLHNTGQHFSADKIQTAYQGIKPAALRVGSTKASSRELLDWVGQLKTL